MPRRRNSADRLRRALKDKSGAKRILNKGPSPDDPRKRILEVVTPDGRERVEVSAKVARSFLTGLSEGLGSLGMVYGRILYKRDLAGDALHDSLDDVNQAARRTLRGRRFAQLNDDVE